MRQILRIQHVIEYVGTSRSFIYRAVASGDFPKPIQLGARAIGWRIDDIEAWMSKKEATSKIAL